MAYAFTKIISHANSGEATICDILVVSVDLAQEKRSVYFKAPCYCDIKSGNMYAEKTISSSVLVFHLFLRNQKFPSFSCSRSIQVETKYPSLPCT